MSHFFIVSDKAAQSLLAAIFLYLIGLFACLAPAKASESALSQAYTIAVVEYPFTNAPSQYGPGLNVDWVSAALKAVNVEHRFTYLPIQRAFKWFEHNRYIALIGTDRLFAPAVRQQLSLIELEPSYIRLFYHKSHLPEPKIHSLEALKTHDIASVTVSKSLLSAHVNKIVYTQNSESVLALTRRGHVSFGAMLDITGLHLIRTLYPQRIHEFGTVKRPVFKERAGLVINQQFTKASSLETQFQQGLARIKQDGTFERIKRHYLGEAYDLIKPTTLQPLISPRQPDALPANGAPQD